MDARQPRTIAILLAALLVLTVGAMLLEYRAPSPLWQVVGVAAGLLTLAAVPYAYRRFIAAPAPPLPPREPAPAGE